MYPESKIPNRAGRNSGFSTLEMLIAMTILILVLSAVILVSFGNQSVLTDSQTNTEALSLAQGLLEQEQALARKDFRLVTPTSTVDGIYQKKVDVLTQSDFYTKKVTATVSWTAEHQRPQSVSLSALVTNFENAVGGDTCDSVLSGNWTNPQIKNVTADFAQAVGDSSGIYPITDLDAYQGKLYVTVNNTAVNTKETLFIFNIADPASPALLGKIDNSPTISAGLGAVRVAGNYAYVANGYGANFGTCTQGNNCAQLQVIDISNPATPSLSFSFKVPGVKGTAGQAVGNTIFYKEGYVYLGLTKTSSGPEFDIIDVHNPLGPFWVGGYQTAAGINAIYVRGKYAYLATPNSQELTILDVSNPTNPTLAGGFDAPDAVGNGKSLDQIGDKLYLGRTVTSFNPELYILDDTVPATNPLPVLGSPQEISSSVNGLLVRDYLAFLVTTNSQFQIWNVANPAGVTQWASPVSLPSSSTGRALDCEENYLFAGSVDPSTNKGYLTVITSGP